MVCRSAPDVAPCPQLGRYNKQMADDVCAELQIDRLSKDKSGSRLELESALEVAAAAEQAAELAIPLEERDSRSWSSSWAASSICLWSNSAAR